MVVSKDNKEHLWNRFFGFFFFFLSHPQKTMRKHIREVRSVGNFNQSRSKFYMYPSAAASDLGLRCLILVCTACQLPA